MVIVKFKGPKAKVCRSIDCLAVLSKLSKLKVPVLHGNMSNIENVDRLLAEDTVHRMPDNVCFFGDFLFVIFVDVESGVVFKCHYKFSFHEFSDVLMTFAFIARYCTIACHKLYCQTLSDI